MKVANISAVTRPGTGKIANARLRAEGRIPAVIYGLDGASQALSVDAHEFAAHVRHHHRVFKLEVGGKQEAAYLQEVQWDSITDEPLHIDFLRIDLTKPIHLVVGVTFVGHPNGISKGGTLIKDHQEIAIQALPDAVPEHIEVNVDALELDDRVLAKDLKLPAGVTLDVDGDTVICHVAIIRVQEVAPAPAAEAAAAPAEPAAAEKGKEAAKEGKDAKDKG